MSKLFDFIKQPLLKNLFLARNAAERLEIEEILQDLKLSEASLAVSTAENTKAESSVSSISAINQKHRVFVLTELSAQCVDGLVKTGSLVQIKTISNGRLVSFEARYLEPFLNNHSLGFLFEFPEKVETSSITNSVESSMSNFTYKKAR